MEGAKRQINLFEHYLQCVLSLPEDVSKCGRIGGGHRAAGRWEESGVRTYDTHWRGEGERVSHWKMQRGGEGIKLGKERRDRWSTTARRCMYLFCF